MTKLYPYEDVFFFITILKSSTFFKKSDILLLISGFVVIPFCVVVVLPLQLMIVLFEDTGVDFTFEFISDFETIPFPTGAVAVGRVTRIFVAEVWRFSGGAGFVVTPLVLGVASLVFAVTSLLFVVAPFVFVVTSLVFVVASLIFVAAGVLLDTGVLVVCDLVALVVEPCGDLTVFAGGGGDLTVLLAIAVCDVTAVLGTGTGDEALTVVELAVVLATGVCDLGFVSFVTAVDVGLGLTAVSLIWGLVGVDFAGSGFTTFGAGVALVTALGVDCVEGFGCVVVFTDSVPDKIVDICN